MGGKDVRMRCLESRAETEHHPHQKRESFKNEGGKREDALQDERQPHARMPGGSAGTQRAGGGQQGPPELAGGTSEQQRYRTRRDKLSSLETSWEGGQTPERGEKQSVSDTLDLGTITSPDGQVNRLHHSHKSNATQKAAERREGSKELTPMREEEARVRWVRTACDSGGRARKGRPTSDSDQTARSLFRRTYEL